MAFKWVLSLSLLLAVVGEVRVGKRVFITKGVSFEGGMSLEVGDVGVTRKEADAEDHFEVEIKGILVDAPAKVLEVLPDFTVGDRVELSPDIRYDGVNYYDRHQTALIKRITHGSQAAIQYVRDSVHASVPVAYLIPECYGRGSRGSSETCVCNEPYSGPLCLTAQPPSVMSIVSQLIASVTPSIPSMGDPPPTPVPTAPVKIIEVTNLMWEGHVYDSIIEADQGTLKDILSSASYTLLLACTAWEARCTPALDTLNTVSLNGTAGSKYQRPVQECYESDAISLLPNEMHIRKVYVDSTVIRKPNSGPYLMLLKGKSLYKEYIGDMTDARRILSFINNLSTGHLDDSSAARLLLSSDVAIIVDSENIDDKDAMFKELEIPHGIWDTAHDEVQLLTHQGLVIMGSTERSSMVVYIKESANTFRRYPYTRQWAVNRVWEWVQDTAVPLVTKLTQHNFDAEATRVRERMGAMIIATGLLEGFHEAAAVHRKIPHKEHALAHYTLDSKGSELLRRFGHGKYIVAIPHLEMVHWTNELPLMYEGALAAVRDYAGLPVSAVQMRAGNESPQAGLEGVLRLKEADLYSAATDFKGRSMLLVVRTTWCWHCRALLPSLPVLSAALARYTEDILVAEHIADDTTFPPWLTRHVKGYPEILLITFGYSTHGIARYKSSNRTISALLSFALGTDIDYQVPEPVLTDKQRAYRKQAQDHASQRQRSTI